MNKLKEYSMLVLAFLAFFLSIALLVVTCGTMESMNRISKYPNNHDAAISDSCVCDDTDSDGGIDGNINIR